MNLSYFESLSCDKNLEQRQLGEEEVYFIFTVCSSSSREVRTGTQGRKWGERHGGVSQALLLWTCLACFLLSTDQVWSHPQRAGPSYSYCQSSKRPCRPIWWRIFPMEVSSSKRTRLCQADIKQVDTAYVPQICMFCQIQILFFSPMELASTSAQ